MPWPGPRYHQYARPDTPNPDSSGFQMTRLGEVSCGFVAFEFRERERRKGGVEGGREGERERERERKRKRETEKKKSKKATNQEESRQKWREVHCRLAF